MRSIFLILFLAVTYTLLYGWPRDAAPLVRGIAAVLVLTAGLGLWARRVPPAIPLALSRRRARAVDFLTMASWLVALNCLLLLFISSAPEPAAEFAYSLHATLAPEGRAASRHRAESASAATAANGNWLWNQETRRDLPRKTNFKPGNNPQVYLTLENPAEAAALVAARPYVRAYSLGEYRKSSWTTVAGPPVELVAGTDGLLHFPKLPGHGIRHKIYHGYDRSSRNRFTALQGAESVRLPSLTQLADGLYILPPPLTNLDGYEYSAVSKPMRIEDLDDSADVHVGLGIPAALLALPTDPTLRLAISDLAIQHAGSGSLVDRLRRLQKFLRTSLTYSLTILNPDNRDPLENFLFHEKRGHCELYATAGALFARAIGIPSRIAYGWAGGSYSEDKNLFVFHAYEAHAWAEVWLEPYGWVVFDPTPPNAIARPPADLAEPHKPAPLPDPAEFLDQRPDPSALSQQPRRAALIFSAIFLPAAAALLLMRSRRTRHERSHHGPRESAIPPGYLQAFRTATARHGHPLPPSRTLRQHFTRLESLGLTPRFAAAFLDYHYRTRYGGSSRDPGEEGMLLREILTWSHSAAASRASTGGRASPRK